MCLSAFIIGSGHIENAHKMIMKMCSSIYHTQQCNYKTHKTEQKKLLGRNIIEQKNVWKGHDDMYVMHYNWAPKNYKCIPHRQVKSLIIFVVYTNQLWTEGMEKECKTSFHSIPVQIYKFGWLLNEWAYMANALDVQSITKFHLPTWNEPAMSCLIIRFGNIY